MARCSGLKFLIEQPLIPNSFRRAAADMKVPALLFEGGESIRLDKLSILSGIRLIRNMLIKLNMSESDILDQYDQKYIGHKTKWIRAEEPGIFIWSKKSGAWIE